MSQEMFLDTRFQKFQFTHWLGALSKWTIHHYLSIPLLFLFAFVAGCSSGYETETSARSQDDATQNQMRVVRAVKVLTDKYVDTTSLDGIVSGIVKDGMTDQQKLIAIYHWYRRLIFHHRYMGHDRRNVLNSINSYGCNLCGSQAAVFTVILKAAGFQTRVVCADGGEGFGNHTFVEVNYGGKWHAIDTMTNFFVFNKERPPQIASLEEIKRDPALVTKALKERRAPDGFLTCMKNPDVTTKDIPWLEGELGMKKDRRWATITFEGGNLLDFWTRAPKKWRILTTGTYGGHYVPGVLDIALKPNEEYVRLWDNVGKWISGPSYTCHGPHHTCGHTDEHDTANFRFFEPYKKKHFGLTKACYRYYGNGWLEWKPVSPAEIESSCEGIKNLFVDGEFLKTLNPGKEGVLNIPVKSPYAIVEVEVEIKSRGGGHPTVSLSITDAKRKMRFQDIEMVGMSENGCLRYVQKLKNPLFSYNLQIKAPEDTAFRLVRLMTIFQLNIYSLPGFFPGENTVTISAEPLEGHSLLVTYEWDDGPGWKRSRKVTKETSAFPVSFKINVEGPKMPRMKRLTIGVRKH